MNGNVKVSVIVPAYNVEKYIEASVESLIRQTYRDIEIIVVDDGSTDRTFETVEKMAAADPRVRALRQENGGVSSARNKGLELACGEFICFLDSDDTAEETMIEELLTAIEKSEADMVECRYSRWMPDGDIAENYNFTRFDLAFGSDEERLRFITSELLLYHMGFEVWNKIYRSRIIRDRGIVFDEGCRMGEDLSFNIKYLLNCNKIFSVSARLVRYLIREDSAMSEVPELSKRISDDLIIASDIMNYADIAGKEEIVRHFPDFFVRMMDHACSLRSATEAAAAFSEIRDPGFAKKMYRRLDCSRENFERLYGDDSPINRSKYHLYVKCSIGAASCGEKVLMHLYRLNRKRQGKSMPEEWKLPY